MRVFNSNNSVFIKRYTLEIAEFRTISIGWHKRLGLSIQVENDMDLYSFSMLSRRVSYGFKSFLNGRIQWAVIRH